MFPGGLGRGAAAIRQMIASVVAAPGSGRYSFAATRSVNSSWPSVFGW
jgi:hypothetical protein